MQKRVLFLALAALLLCGAVYGENRTALVIGNGAYRHFQSLPRPRPEAIEMSNTLKALGFEVITVLDGSYDQMLDAVMSFERKLNQRKGIALFHYGGHGVQVGGENYLLPVDREIPDEMRVRSRALNVSEIVSAMRSSGAGSNIIILDACRDNPLPAATRSTSSRGLARLDAPVNSIVVYSADAGKTAQDGVFTPTLIEQMKIPGLTITEVMMRVRQEVYRKTGGSQMPGEYSQLFEQIYLAGAPGRTTPAPPVSGRQEPTTRPAPGQVNSVGMTFITVEGGSFQMGSPSGGSNDERPVRRVTLSSFQMAATEVTQSQYEWIMRNNPSDSDNGIGPDNPVNKVSWYDAIVYANRLSMAEGLTPVYSIGGSTDPARWGAVPTSGNATWNSATMNTRANGYRLPTEAEWEYAARGGNRSRGYTYAGSNSLDDVAWHNGNSGGRTKPVGTKAPNELGLYDMSGNILEWCWDWHGNYPGSAQTDPSGPSSGMNRVLRGSGYAGPARFSRSAYRYSNFFPQNRSSVNGFRLVRAAVR
jgi:formylglycine-generating enzyme required for sulfatase activity